MNVYKYPLQNLPEGLIYYLNIYFSMTKIWLSLIQILGLQKDTPKFQDIVQDFCFLKDG